MAIRILKASKLLSASGTFYERVEASNLTVTLPLQHVNNWTNFSSTRTISVTFANAGNQLGIMLHIRHAYVGTLTIVLKEGTTVRTTDTFNFATNPLQPDANALPGWHYFPLTSYAVTTTPATWTYEISCTSSTPAAYVTTNGGTNFLYMVALDADSSKVASGDTLVLADSVTLRVDESVTHGTAGGIGVILSYGAVYECLNADLSAPITISNAGQTSFPSATSKYYIGTSADPITVAHRVTLAPPPLMLGYTNTYGFSAASTLAVELYGVEATDIHARIASEAASGQAHIITTVDMSGTWAIGDHLCIVGKARPLAIDVTNYTISNISGTDITLNANLDYKVLAGGAIVNQDAKNRCGIWCTSTTADTRVIYAGIYMDYVHVVGVYFYKVNFSVGIMFLLNNTKNLLIRNVLYDDGTANPSNTPFMFQTAHNAVVSGLFYYHSTGSYVGYGFLIISGNRMTISNVVAKNLYAVNGNTLPSYSGAVCAINIGGSGCTISGLVVSGGRYTTGNHILISLIGGSNTISDIFIYAITTYGLFLNLYNSTITNIVLNGAWSANITASTCVGLTINGLSLGATTPAGVAEIEHETAQLSQLLLNSPTVGAGIVALTANISNALVGSYTRIQNYNGTATDCRGVEVYGKYVSTGSGLADTVVHTAGGYALRREPTSSLYLDEWAQTIPTGNIQNKTMMVGIWCKINNAAYYGGVHQKPRLTINYDNGTTAYAEAIATTDWQFLSVPFTPTTTYGQIVATLSTMTDQSGSNAYVYFDDYVVLFPAGYQLNLGSMDLWANALPVMPTIATNLSALDVLTASTLIDYGDDTIGELLKTTEKKADDAAALILAK